VPPISSSPFPHELAREYEVVFFGTQTVHDVPPACLGTYQFSQCLNFRTSPGGTRHLWKGILMVPAGER